MSWLIVHLLLGVQLANCPPPQMGYIAGPNDVPAFSAAVCYRRKPHFERPMRFA